MSPTIWTRCAAACRPRAHAFETLRVVESQYVVSTRKLVDSDAEQALLESLIDGAKPPVPKGMGRLHYLLFTPFRHPPLPNGSRFGRRTEPGVFYGSGSIETALAEVAYYRLVFLEGTRARLPVVATEHTAFTAKVQAARFVDLTRAPFAAFEAELASKTDYRKSQALGHDLRAAGVDALAFRSARDPGRGLNHALFEPVFASPKPSRFHGWLCHATRERVEFREKSFLQPASLAFERGEFTVDGVLPTPAA